MEARPRKKSAKGVESNPSSSSSSCSIASLPNPLLMEILCRVPIKTLTTSKSVCKSWLNLIKDPYFCQMHQRRSPNEVWFQPYHDSKGNTLELHLGHFHFPNNLDPCHFQIPKFSVSPHNVPDYETVEGRFIFANSCNGLLCYYGGDPDYRFAVVWNPCTSEFITFPPPPSRCYGYGLGFSRKENKFKLLRLMGVSSPSDMIVADICTIEKSCSWKRVDPCSTRAWFRNHWNHSRHLHAVSLQSTLNWVGIGRRGSGGRAIYTFDFEDDRFGTLGLPPCSYVRYSEALRGDKLGELGGCLFVTDYTSEGMIIWSMREYGVQASWTKLLCLGRTSDKGLEYEYCRPVTYMDNGEILMICTYPSTVFVFNPVLKSVRVMGSGQSVKVIAYNPSLVLLKASMLGYDVHVKPNGSGLEKGEISTTPNWWTPVKESQQQDDELSDAQVEEEREENVSAMSESSASEESSDGAMPESSEGISEERRFRLMSKMSLAKAMIYGETQAQAGDGETQTTGQRTRAPGQDTRPTGQATQHTSRVG